jgi:glycosyltransferase involved in cell wall biosynthesis
MQSADKRPYSITSAICYIGLKNVCCRVAKLAKPLAALLRFLDHRFYILYYPNIKNIITLTNSSLLSSYLLVFHIFSHLATHPTPMTNKPKILVIPSWYATPENPLAGPFFQEQAHHMNQHGFVVRVLWCEAVSSSRSEFWLRKARLKLRAYTPAVSPYPIGLPPAWSFQYPTCPEATHLQNIFMQIQHYVAAYEQLVVHTGWQPDLIHAQCLINGGLVAHFIQQHVVTPYVVTEHMSAGYWAECALKLPQDLLFSGALSAKQLATVSHAKAAELISWGFEHEPFVVGNLVDETLFTPANPATPPSPDFRLVTIAGNSISKGLETIFQALEWLHNHHHTNVMLTVIGIEIEKDNYIRQVLASYPAAQKAITWAGKVPRKHMPAQYHQADVLVSTSISESFGLSVAEAIACGKPVIVTRSGGIDDIVDQSNGIKIHIRDWQALADAILKIKNKTILFDLEKARRGIVHKFGREAFAQRQAALYRQAIAPDIPS